MNMTSEPGVTFLREAAKKKKKFNGPAIKAFTPPPLGLVAIRNFFPYIDKKFVFPSGRDQPPSPLVAGPLKNNFFCGFPYRLRRVDIVIDVTHVGKDGRGY